MIEIINIFYLWLFIFLMVGTPGPANLLIMSIGANNGVKKCMPFNFGLIGGKFLLNIGMAFGFIVILNDYKNIQLILKFVSASYLIYLSLKNWNNENFSQNNYVSGFKEGLIVHPLNPKAWVMIIIAWTEFGPYFGNILNQFIIISLSFVVFQLFLHSLWCYFGYILNRSLSNNKILNRTLICITIIIVIWAVIL